MRNIDLTYILIAITVLGLIVFVSFFSFFVFEGPSEDITIPPGYHWNIFLWFILMFIFSFLAKIIDRRIIRKTTWYNKTKPWD